MADVGAKPPLSQRLRAEMARRRHSVVMRAADRAAFKIQNAIRNRHNFVFEVNGELWLAKSALEGNRGAAVLDVGANKGQWATSEMPYLGDHELHCFEVVPAMFDELSREIGERPGVRLNRLGLGASAGELEFNYCHNTPEASGHYPIDKDYRSGVIERVTADVVTGDSYCAEHGIDRVSLLKIDVEGMECEVLEGFLGMIGQQRIAVVQFEYGPGYIDARRYLRDAMDLFGDAGYGLRELFPDRLEPFDYPEAENFMLRNFVAVAPGRHI